MGVPDVLTVEEAARVLRVGRTKAYLMAREWRDTGGRCGLPVVDFGSVLRVPRAALEALLGAELTVPTAPPGTGREKATEADSAAGETPRPEPAPPRRSRARRSPQPDAQLTLFPPTPPRA